MFFRSKSTTRRRAEWSEGMWTLTDWSDWNCIASDPPPPDTPVIVGNQTDWTLARYIQLEAQTLQLRWPFISTRRVGVWVFSCSRYRRINFHPTHWSEIVITPPPKLEDFAE